jgi:hypothetical protein
MEPGVSETVMDTGLACLASGAAAVLVAGALAD